VGASFYGGDSQQTNNAPAIWTTMVEAHAEFRSYGFQARAIYARVTNSGDGLAALGPEAQAFATGTVQAGGYVEAGFDVLSLIPSTRMALIPFVRYERFNTQVAVAPGATVDPANLQTNVYLGANFKPIPQVAVKLDYDIRTNAARTGRNQFNVALAYLF
jgi:phosphate-selective porin